MGIRSVERWAQRSNKYVPHMALHVLKSLPAETARSCLAFGIPVYLARYVRARVRRAPGVRAARFSLREEKAVSWDEAAFDETTILGHMKIIEQRILHATEDFLWARNIDTSAFEKRAETIVNASVLNMGGTTNINQSAVGSNAQVNQNSTPQPATQGAQK